MFAFLIEALWNPRVIELLLFKSTETRIFDHFFSIRRTRKTKRSKGRVAGEDMLIFGSEIFNFTY